ncbi:hypothetical protein [Desulfovibrio inopinatus]|uniref:hypothetical protein n=1 Tax=Desulfovibrio inopinatus TaxID=102109 RepID=UPI00040739C2|nr:hypothetical protein [Desulfovibrio inopinatus]
MPKETGQFFKTSVFLSLTIGVPFCLFKGLFGYLLVINGFMMAGTAFLLWALLDLIMNFLRASLEVLGHPDPPTQFCLFGQIGHYWGRKNLLMSIDTFFSFSIICFVLWSGWVQLLPPWGLVLWLLATTINLMSLAVMNVWLEIMTDRNQAESQTADNS